MSRIVTVAVQVLPLTDDPYPVVDRAIAAIQASGLKYQVCPLETVLEGTWDECMKAAQAAHEACFTSGVQRAVTIIKISDGVDGSTIADKLEKYRP
ncbi:MAG: thiamine-binding protein [Anaerolineae bacterium]